MDRRERLESMLRAARMRGAGSTYFRFWEWEILLEVVRDINDEVAGMATRRPSGEAPPAGRVDLSGPAGAFTAEEREAVAGALTPLVLRLPDLTEDQADHVWRALAEMFRAGRRSALPPPDPTLEAAVRQASHAADWRPLPLHEGDAIKAVCAEVRRLRGWA